MRCRDGTVTDAGRRQHHRGLRMSTVPTCRFVLHASGAGSKSSNTSELEGGSPKETARCFFVSSSFSRALSLLPGLMPFSNGPIYGCEAGATRREVSALLPARCSESSQTNNTIVPCPSVRQSITRCIWSCGPWCLATATHS